jgi:DNA polymerase
VAEPDDLFRRYLQTRISLGEPELVLPGLDRREARRRARKAAIRGAESFAPLAPGEEPGAPAPSAPAGDGGAGAPADEGEGHDGAAGRTGGTDSPAREETPPAAADPDPGVDVERLAREGDAEEISEIPDMTTLRAVAERCTRCPLHETRKQVVFGEGDPHARLVCVGEAPGAREDETGRPFVGRAGKLLDRLLLAVGFHREEVYICNVLKSRPPDNRDPKQEEISACAPFLLRQLDLLDPAVIVAFGAFASRTLLDTSGSLGSLRGRVHRFRGYPLVATYHPAALLRNPSWTQPTWRDLQRARRLVDDAAGADRPGRDAAAGASGAGG